MSYTLYSKLRNKPLTPTGESFLSSRRAYNGKFSGKKKKRRKKGNSTFKESFSTMGFSREILSETFP